MATPVALPVILTGERERFYHIGATSAGVPIVAKAVVLVDADGVPIASGSPASDVTVTNGPGAAAVNIQDGGNSITVDDRRTTLVGVYHAPAVQTVVTQAADGATAGRAWLLNPVGSGVVVAVRRLAFASVSATALVTLTVPNFNVERITFTGTSSAAAVTPCKVDSNYANATAKLVNATTGITPVAGAAAKAFQCHSTLTGVGQSQAVEQLFPSELNREEFIVLRAGQGIVIRQATGGTLADTRNVRVDISWEEYTE